LEEIGLTAYYNFNATTNSTSAPVENNHGQLFVGLLGSTFVFVLSVIEFKVLIKEKKRVETVIFSLPSHTLHRNFNKFSS